MLKCQLLSLSPFSSIISLITSLSKKISCHIIIDKKGIPHILFFSTQQLFNLIFRNTEPLIYFTEVSELVVPLSSWSFGQLTKFVCWESLKLRFKVGKATRFKNEINTCGKRISIAILTCHLQDPFEYDFFFCSIEKIPRNSLKCV